MVDKRSLKAELLGRVTRELEAIERAHRSAVEGATHEEAKPENDKDTRAVEASYLARGQAQRVEELRRALAELRAWSPRTFDAASPIGLGALVELDDETASTWYFIAPSGGGSILSEGAVKVVTPRSPLGRALLGKAMGDDVEIVVEGTKRSASVSQIE